MASSLLPTFTIPFAKPRKTSLLLFTSSTSWTPSFNVVTKCESKESSGSIPPPRTTKLEIGSPVIVVEAPKMIKTAASVPCLRINSGFVKPGDVGRIVSRKPKDVWAVRLSIGTYLIDAKYFKPLDLPE